VLPGGLGRVGVMSALLLPGELQPLRFMAFTLHVRSAITKHRALTGNVTPNPQSNGRRDVGR
jgi:hypothetical protein